MKQYLGGFLQYYQMFKTIATLLTVLGTLTYFIVFLMKYVPYVQLLSLSPTHLGYSEFRLPQVGNTTDKQKILKHLYELAKFPVIGFLFDDDKIEELIRLQKYEECIKQAEKILQKIFYERSFIIWYYKAVAQCRLFKKDECQASLNKAILYAKGHMQKWRIQNLHNYIQQQFLQHQGLEQLIHQKEDIKNKKRSELQEIKLKSLQEL